MRAISKGRKAAVELRRLGGLSLIAVQQIFTLTLAPVVGDASNVWMRAFKEKANPIKFVSSVEAQAFAGHSSYLRPELRRRKLTLSPHNTVSGNECQTDVETTKSFKVRSFIGEPKTITLEKQQFSKITLEISRRLEKNGNHSVDPKRVNRGLSNNLT